jgi:YbbR domain-containing protein
LALRGLLVRDITLKLLCLGLAAFLWMVVFRAGVRETEISLSVPVELVNIPPALAVTRPPRETVEVRIRGPRRVVSRVPESDLVFPLDLAKAREGETAVRLRASSLRLPEHAEVERITPSSVAVTLERLVTVRLPVRVPVQGEPRAGYAVGAVTADPPYVEVRGPRSAVVRIREVAAAPLSVADAGGSVTAELALLPPADDVRLLDPSATVKATAAIRAAR